MRSWSHVITWRRKKYKFDTRLQRCEDNASAEAPPTRCASDFWWHLCLSPFVHDTTTFTPVNCPYSIRYWLPYSLPYSLPHWLPYSIPHSLPCSLPYSCWKMIIEYGIEYGSQYGNERGSEYGIEILLMFLKNLLSEFWY